MSPTMPHLAPRTVAMPVEFLAALENAARDTGDAGAVDRLRDAGYHAGQALFDRFASWTAERGDAEPESLPHARFAALASEFFDELGWGPLAFSPVSDAVMALDMDAPGSGSGGGGLIATGMFAGFFGRLAEAPIAILEVPTHPADGARSRFLLGSIDVLGYVHEAMERGIPYERAAASA
jgi:hypothetical protein